MIRAHSDVGIIVKRINVAEADKIVTVLTKESGKVALVAKGIRKIQSRRKGHVELFNHVRFSYVKGEGLGLVTEVEALEVFDDVAKVWEPLGQAYHICEIVDRLLPEYEPNEYVYRLLLRALQVLKQEPTHARREEVVRLFEISLLQHLGYWNGDEYDTSISAEQKKKFHIAYIEQLIERQLQSKLVFQPIAISRAIV